MGQRIIFTNSDGGTSVVAPAPNSGLTIQEIAARVVPDGVSFEIVDESEAPDDSIDALRAAATLPRETFLLGCVAAGIITEAEAEEAADGSWPSSFNTFLAGMTASQRIEAKALWASRADVRRTSPLLALVAANKSVTDQQLDTLFGIGG